MKLLIIADMYPSDANPIFGIFIKEQVEQLKKYHEVKVIVIGRKFIGIGVRSLLRYVLSIFLRLISLHDRKNNRESITKKTSDNGVMEIWKDDNVFRIRYPVFVIHGIRLYIFSGISVFFCFINQLKKIHFKPDLIHAHKSFPPGYVACMLKKFMKVPVLISEHQGPFSGYFDEAFQGRRVLNAINVSDKTICTSFQKNNIMQYKVRTDKLEAMPIVGIDTDKFFFDETQYIKRKKFLAEKKVKLLNINQVSELKGTRIVIGAVNLLIKEFPCLHLTIIGSLDNGAEKILSLIHTYKLENNIKYEGIVLNDQLPYIINNHDILVSASLHETFGVNIIEGMSCGRPVVVTKCGGPEEIVKDNAGVLVPPNDSKCFAESITYVIKNYEVFDPINIRDNVIKNYNQMIVIYKLNAIYRELSNKQLCAA